MKQIKHILLVILFLTSTSVVAQQQNSNTNSGKGLRRSVAAAMFSTIGGAVLGLSTLSFYGKPQEHTGNITMGALIGLVVGVGYMSYDANRAPQTSGSYDFSQTERQDLRAKGNLAAAGQGFPAGPYQIQYQFGF